MTRCAMMDCGWALVTTGKGNSVRFFVTNGDGMSPRLDVEEE